MRIGIFLPNWVGDVVMATPALRGLRSHLSDRATLVGIMRPYVSQVLDGTHWLDDAITYDHKKTLGRANLVRELRKASLDTILLLTNSLSTAALAWASGARRRIGFAMHRRRWLLTDPLQIEHSGGSVLPRSAVDHYLDVIHAFGCDSEDRRVELATTADEEAAADKVWRRFGWSTADPVAILNTGGAYGSAKSWPSQHFAQLALHLATDRAANVLVICGPTERAAAAHICRIANHRRVQSLATESLSIGLSKVCIRRSHLMITTDSGPRHLAAAFRVPVATIFGPTDPKWSDNYHPSSVDLQLDVECGPCSRRVCPLKHHRCMHELTSRHVIASAQHLLDMAVPRRAA